MPTRAQKMLLLAESRVTQVDEEVEARTPGTKNIYGGLCHSFPVMVITCGLCQAYCFSLDKSRSGESARAAAHRRIVQDVDAILGRADGNGDGSHIRQGGVRAYMLNTALVLDAWIYFKRFAVSILDVGDAAAADNAAGAADEGGDAGTGSATL